MGFPLSRGKMRSRRGGLGARFVWAFLRLAAMPTDWLWKTTGRARPHSAVAKPGVFHNHETAGRPSVRRGDVARGTVPRAPKHRATKCVLVEAAWVRAS